MTFAFVTGGSRGIGRATALELARRGVDVGLLGQRSLALDEVKAALETLGRWGGHFEADLADPEQTRRISFRLSQLEGIDLFIHAAGVIQRDPVAELDEAEWRKQLEINLTAPLLLSRAVLKGMLRRRSGRILFVSSISATMATPTQSAYNASKAGLTMAMRCLAEELKDTGLMTAAVLPGAVDTDMLRGSSFAARMGPEEVARTLAFLALDASVAHNGATIEMFGV